MPRSTDLDRQSDGDNCFQAQRGFTLVELLVVIAIISILIALLLPAVQAAREASRGTACANRIRQLIQAAHSFHDARGQLPPHGDYPSGMSSQARLLPYLENRNLWDLLNPDKHWRDPINAPSLRTKLSMLRCPSASPMQWTSFRWREGEESEASMLPSHYVGNMGARPRNCGGAAARNGRPSNGIASLPWPLNTYSQLTGGCPIEGFAWSSGGIATNGTILPSTTQSNTINFSKITDGISKTIMYAELSWDVDFVGRMQEQPIAFGPWIVGSTSVSNSLHGQTGYVQNAKNIRYGIHEKPLVDQQSEQAQSHLTDVSLGSNHPGGVYLGMCDGSIRFVTETVDLESVLYRMASRASEDQYEGPD